MSLTQSSRQLLTERIALAAVFFMLGALFASWAGRIPQIQEGLALNDGQLGMAMFCLAIGALISMPASGPLAAKVSSARATFLFCLAFSVTLVLIPLAFNWLL